MRKGGENSTRQGGRRRKRRRGEAVVQVDGLTSEELQFPAAFSLSCMPACYSRHVLSSLLTRFFKCSSNVCRPPRAVLPIRLSLATPGSHVLKPSLSLQTGIGRERLPSSKSGGSCRIAERERDGRDEVGRVKGVADLATTD